MIPHIHFHIIPRYPGDGQDFSWKHVKYGEGEMEEYKNSMDRVAGPQASNYVKEDELAEDHKQFVSRSLDKFNSIATFGSKSSIEKSKRDLLGKIDKDFEMYKSLNNGRNPLLGLEL